MNGGNLKEKIHRLTSDNEKLHNILVEAYGEYSSALKEDLDKIDEQEAGEIHSALRVHNKQMKSIIQQITGAVAVRNRYPIHCYVPDPCRYCCKEYS